jgi:IS5 family transposase
MIDSTHVQVRQYGTGARGGNQAMAHTNGGLNTKLHVAVGKVGRSLRVMTTEATEPDCKRALELVAALDADYILADKAYDSDEIICSLSSRGIVPIIPSKIDRKSQRSYDRNIYKKRPIIKKFVPQNERNGVPFLLDTSKIFSPLSRPSMSAHSLFSLSDFDNTI